LSDEKLNDRVTGFKNLSGLMQQGTIIMQQNLQLK
jgi:hypothetical protein